MNAQSIFGLIFMFEADRQNQNDLRKWTGLFVIEAAVSFKIFDELFKFFSKALYLDQSKARIRARFDALVIVGANNFLKEILLV